MTGAFLAEKVEKLRSVFLNIMNIKAEDSIIKPNVNQLTDLQNALNAIFDENDCTEVLYTENTDKLYFGIRINPWITPVDAVKILATDEEMKFNKYQIEFDSKIFDILDADQLVAVTLYELSYAMDNPSIFEAIRALVDLSLVGSDDVISIRDSVNYSQLIIFALKDTIYKLSSIIFRTEEEDITSNPIIQALSLEETILAAKNTLDSVIVADSMRSPRIVILQWMLSLYQNIPINGMNIHDTLVDAKTFTSSKLEKSEIDKTLASIDRIDEKIPLKEDIDLHHFFDMKHVSSLNEVSLFKSMRKNGLRALENELYEFTMKAKNVKEQDEAYLLMRGINTRLGILEDYLAREDISESERQHWEAVAMKYRALRSELANKKIQDKQYGLFFDYNQLDQLDQ